MNRMRKDSLVWLTFCDPDFFFPKRLATPMKAIHWTQRLWTDIIYVTSAWNMSRKIMKGRFMIDLRLQHWITNENDKNFLLNSLDCLGLTLSQHLALSIHWWSEVDSAWTDSSSKMFSHSFEFSWTPDEISQLIFSWLSFDVLLIWNYVLLLCVKRVSFCIWKNWPDQLQ